jgi:hypothetical protein
MEDKKNAWKVFLGMFSFMAVLGALHGINTKYNSKYIKTSSFERTTRPADIFPISVLGAPFGHREYTQYKDGSVNLKVIHGLCKLILKEGKENILGKPNIQRVGVEYSRLIQDLDGDGFADIITIKGVGWRTRFRYGPLQWGLSEVMEKRRFYYGIGPKEFEDANKLLRKEREYFNKKRNNH